MVVRYLVSLLILVTLASCEYYKLMHRDHDKRATTTTTGSGSKTSTTGVVIEGSVPDSKCDGITPTVCNSKKATNSNFPKCNYQYSKVPTVNMTSSQFTSITFVRNDSLLGSDDKNGTKKCGTEDDWNKYSTYNFYQFCTTVDFYKLLPYNGLASACVYLGTGNDIDNYDNSQHWGCARLAVRDYSQCLNKFYLECLAMNLIMVPTLNGRERVNNTDVYLVSQPCKLFVKYGNAFTCNNYATNSEVCHMYSVSADPTEYNWVRYPAVNGFGAPYPPKSN